MCSVIGLAAGGLSAQDQVESVNLLRASVTPNVFIFLNLGFPIQIMNEIQRRKDL